MKIYGFKPLTNESAVVNCNDCSKKILPRGYTEHLGTLLLIIIRVVILVKNLPVIEARTMLSHVVFTRILIKASFSRKKENCEKIKERSKEPSIKIEASDTAAVDKNHAGISTDSRVKNEPAGSEGNPELVY